jgi:hypothetical protein
MQALFLGVSSCLLKTEGGLLETVWILETGCYEDRIIVGVFSSPEKAMSAHCPAKPASRTDTYKWSPEHDGCFVFMADFQDFATVTRMKIDAPE